MFNCCAALKFVWMQLTAIKEFEENSVIQGFFVCLEKRLRTTRSGDAYLDLLLQDASGRITARIWENADHFNRQFDVGDAVAIKGSVERYKGALQLICSQVARATTERYARYGFREELLIPTIDEDPKELWARLLELIGSVKNRPIKRLLREVFKTWKATILILPASLKHHHPLRGGFLQHLVSTGQLAQLLAGHEPRLDRDLLLAGVLLHDIGKVRGLKTGLDANYTDQGQLIGHVVLGRDILQEAAAKLGNMPEELLLKLEHMILSHQGSLAAGSPQPPRFPEALAAHHIDHLDGQLDLIFRELDAVDDEAPFTDNRNHFRTALWKHYDR